MAQSAPATLAAVSFEPDWGSLRAAAVRVGVREAARQASSHLPSHEQQRFVFRVLKRSQRENWLSHVRQSIQRSNEPKGHNKGLSSPVLSGADALLRQQREDSDACRAAVLKTGRATLEAAANEAITDPLVTLARSSDIKAMTGAVALAANWQQPTSSGNVAVNIAVLTNPPEWAIAAPADGLERVVDVQSIPDSGQPAPDSPAQS